MPIAKLVLMIAALKEALAAERARGLKIAAELAVARAKASEDEALIAQQKLQIAKLRHQIYGQRSERSSRLSERLTGWVDLFDVSDHLFKERGICRSMVDGLQ